MRFLSMSYCLRQTAPRVRLHDPFATRSVFRYVFTLAVTMFLASAPSAYCTILHVSSETEVSGDGRTWETAIASLNEALTVAATGDQIRVQGGTYNEAIELIPEIELYGGFAGTEATHEIELRNPDLNITTIDAVGLNSSVIIGATGAIIDGFTITGGRAPRGGGIFCQRASMTIRNCTVENNYAEGFDSPGVGGGIFLELGDLTLQSCDILNNSANSTFVSSASQAMAAGGGVYLTTGEFVLRDCIISENTTSVDPTSNKTNVYMAGGGGYISGRSSVSRCRISKNFAGGGYYDIGDNPEGEGPFNVFRIAGEGGGLYVDGEITLQACQVYGNVINLLTIQAELLARGGGLFHVGESKIENCVFSGNGATSSFAYEGERENANDIYGKGSALLSNCTIQRLVGYSIFYDGHATIVNSIFTLHGADPGSFSISYSDILPRGGSLESAIEHFPNAGNINQDPQFIELFGDLRLRADSPCIDAGTDVMLTTDVLGATRPVDIPGVGREGPGALDMGAYEFQLADFPTPTPTLVSVRSDIDEDGLRNQNDLFVFQSDWLKPAPPTPGATFHNERSNINLDQGIDALDLLILLSDWKKTTD